MLHESIIIMHYSQVSAYLQCMHHVVDDVIRYVSQFEFVRERGRLKWQWMSLVHPRMSDDVCHFDSLTRVGAKETLQQILAL